MHTTLSSDRTELTIQVPNPFVFDVQREFRLAYENVPQSVNSITIDLSSVEYIDSSAIGMLLILKEFTEAGNIKLTITSCNEYVYKVFRVAHMTEEMDISQSGQTAS